MWATNYKWLWILSSIPDPYCPFYDSTYLFDYCYYPLMTICDISLSWQCTRENGTLHQYRPFLIYELHSDYSSKPSFSLCYIQHHSLCEHHHNETGFVNDLWLTYQQPTSEWSSLSLPVKEILLVTSTAFKRHSSIIFQRIPFVSWIQSSHLINIIHQSIQYPHALISSSYYLFAIEISSWHSPLHSINTHFLFPFHMISIPLIQTHSHSEPLKHTPTVSILASLCNPWFQ